MNNLMRMRMLGNKNEEYNPQSNSFSAIQRMVPEKRNERGVSGEYGAQDEKRGRWGEDRTRGGWERVRRNGYRNEWEDDDEEDDDEKRRKKKEKEGRKKAIKAGGTFWMDDGEEDAEPLTKEQAEKWVREMHGAGSEGEKWSMDDLKAVAQKHGIPMEGEKFVEFYAVMNALYSDYAEVAKKYNVNNPDFFANMAKAWMNDKDAVDNKTAIYYERIVKK